MDVDQRLERLVERHEALAQSVEILNASIQEQHAAIQQQGRNIDKILDAVEKDSENIRALARIAEIHEHRITGLEGGGTA